MESIQVFLKLDGLFKAKGKVPAKTIQFILNLDSWQKLIKNRSFGNIGFWCIAEYFYWLCRQFWRARRAILAILHNKTSNKRFIIQPAKLLCPWGRISRIFMYGECVTGVCQAERNWRGKSSLPIGEKQKNKANWFWGFRTSQHWRNLFHFSQREKIVFPSSKLHINFYFKISVKENVEKKSVLTNKNFFRNFNPIRRLCVSKKPV